jgi:type II secretory pathway predicted ATPase ExeA
LEHLHHFGLSEDPFRADAPEKFDVDLPSQRDALARLDRGVRQGRGLCVLVGGAGAGKTRVARHLYEGLEEELFEAAMMVVLRREVGVEWLLPRIARQLGVERADLDREAVIRQIYERLAIIHEDGRRAVLIIDDAHGLANADTLSELCGLVKLEYEDRRLATVVLVGAPHLDEVIAADRLVCHQVDVRVPLAPLDCEEAASYVAARVEAAGASADLWLPSASAALHELAEGAPGRVNRLADNALYEAWIAGHAQVTRADVERAHRDLGWGGAHAVRRAAPVEAERTDPIAFEEAAAPAVDLDPEIDAVFEEPDEAGHRASAEAHRTVVMDFDSDAELTMPPAPRGQAERTRIQLDEPDAPPKTDDVDDLFMELLDD